MSEKNQLTIYHNPRCSKSRQTLELLQDKGIEHKVFEYLKEPMNKSQLEDLFKALDKKAKDVLRTKEEEYKALSINLDDDSQVIEAIISHPKILERPIVISSDGKAAIGRPPENVLALLDSNES